MSSLTPDTPLDGYNRIFNGLSITESSGVEIVSIAIANGEALNFVKRAKKIIGTAPPSPGRWEKTKSDGRILWTGQNHYMLFHKVTNDRLDEDLFQKFKELAYLTLQTDGWATIDVSGERVHDVFERFIPLDLANKHVGFGTRTSAHHMSVFILKLSDMAYQLLTPRSSCSAFLKALESVIESVIESVQYEQSS